MTSTYHSPESISIKTNLQLTIPTLHFFKIFLTFNAPAQTQWIFQTCLQPLNLEQVCIFCSNIGFFARKRFPGGWFYSVGEIFGFFSLALTVVELSAKNQVFEIQNFDIIWSIHFVKVSKRTKNGLFFEKCSLWLHLYLPFEHKILILERTN